MLFALRQTDGGTPLRMLFALRQTDGGTPLRMLFALRQTDGGTPLLMKCPESGTSLPVRVTPNGVLAVLRMLSGVHGGR